MRGRQPSAGRVSDGVNLAHESHVELGSATVGVAMSIQAALSQEATWRIGRARSADRWAMPPPGCTFRASMVSKSRLVGIDAASTTVSGVAVPWSGAGRRWVRVMRTGFTVTTWTHISEYDSNYDWDDMCDDPRGAGYDLLGTTGVHHVPSKLGGAHASYPRRDRRGDTVTGRSESRRKKPRISPILVDIIESVCL